MIIAVLVLMALMLALGLVVSMLGTQWQRVLTALAGGQITGDQTVGASAARALARA